MELQHVFSFPYMNSFSNIVFDKNNSAYFAGQIADLAIYSDVRTAEEFAAGHIPGAINIANEVIGSEEIPELPNKDQKIYVYCRSGNRSKQAAAKLVKLGYTNITEIGGIIDYHGELE